MEETEESLDDEEEEEDVLGERLDVLIFFFLDLAEEDNSAEVFRTSLTLCF